MKYTIKIGPEHIGKTIYGYRHGVNVRGTVQLQRYTVLDVKRKYAQLEKAGEYKSSNMYDRNNGTTQSEANSGYACSFNYWYISPEMFELHMASIKRRKELDEFMRDMFRSPQISDELADELHSILVRENLIKKN